MGRAYSRQLKASAQNPVRQDRRAALAHSMGAHVKPLTPIVIDGVSVPRYDVACKDNEAAIKLYDAWAHDDAQHDPDVRALAQDMLEQCDGKADDDDTYLPRLIQAFVQRYMRFQNEEVETNYETGFALSMGEGDCDDHSSLVVSLSCAAGLQAKVVGVRDGSGEITHAAPIVTVGGRDYWAETTIPALFGEHPYEAAVRLGILKQRPDIGSGATP